MIKKGLISLLMLSLVFPANAFALDLEISGNGSDSESTINVSQEQNTTVQQNNDADINNDVKVDANTGGNTASDNTGGSADIKTGDIQSTGSITNENINVNKVDECPNGCPSGSTNLEVTISGNGSDSENNVSVDSTNTVDIEQDNDADISNDVDLDLNTGNNEAEDNTDGDVSISTGDIDSAVEIVNEDINLSKALAGTPSELLEVLIKGNGADSENEVNVSMENLVSVDVSNSAEIENDVDKDLNTGNNFANGNVGDVDITTGDIDSNVTIRNEGINVSEVEICCEVTPTPTPGENVTPTPTPGAGAVSEEDEEGEAEAAAGEAEEEEEQGEVQGIAGEVLPITGSGLLLILTAIAAGLFGTGLYLRLGKKGGKT